MAVTVQDLDQDIRDRLALADAALGVAGHEVTDPAIRALATKVASGELTGDQAVQAAIKHVLG